MVNFTHIGLGVIFLKLMSSIMGKLHEAASTYYFSVNIWFNIYLCHTRTQKIFFSSNALKSYYLRFDKAYICLKGYENTLGHLPHIGDCVKYSHMSLISHLSYCHICHTRIWNIERIHVLLVSVLYRM